jgi:type IV pilus assembly protein PilP
MTNVMRSVRLVAVGVVLGLATAAAAQAQAGKGKKTPPAATAPTPAPTPRPDLPTPPPNFEYTPEGRRDPFISLVNKGTSATKSNSAAGVPGMMTAELTVRGILLKAGSYVAMVSGPDGKVFTVRAGDKLADGVIRAITANSVVILQEVNDPLSLEKQREVRKFLRSGEEVK